MYHKALFGVADGARTHDNRNHNPGLYQLSYSHRRNEIITCQKTYSVTGSRFPPATGLATLI